MLNHRSILLAAGAALCCLAQCQNLSLTAPVLVNPPKIDGTVSEGEWDGAATLDNFLEQATGKPMPERTVARVGLGEKGVYALIYAYDSQPDRIVGRTVQRGTEFEGEDFVGLILDPMNRRIVAGNSQFFVNPLGTKYENIAGGRAAKREWRGDWEAKATRVADGYVVEMYVPWEMLSFPAGKVDSCLFNVGRVHNRTQTVGYWSDTGRPFRPDNHGTLTNVTFPATSARKQLDLIGYVSPEYDKDSQPRTSVRAGLDLRYRPNERTTGLLSLNPDFRNIEGDIAGIEFTRSERFLEDTRPFFTEGADFFALTGQFTIGRLFYSRRVTDFDQGIKYFGDLSDRSQIGFLATREDRDKGAFAFKYRQQFGPRAEASVFGLNTNGPGVANSVYGAMGEVGSGSWLVDFDLAMSKDGPVNSQAGSAGISYEAPNLFSHLRYIAVDDGFQARLGLIPFVDIYGGYAFIEHPRQFRNGYLRSTRTELFAESYQKGDGTNHHKSASATFSVTSRYDNRLGVWVENEEFGLEKGDTIGLFGGFNVTNRFKSLRWQYISGTRGGDPTRYLDVRGTLRVAPGFDVGLSYSRLDFRGLSEQSVLTAGWEIDEFKSLTARLVRQDGDTNWYLAYRNAGNKGLEYYVIVGDPNSSTARERIAFKVVWAR